MFWFMLENIKHSKYQNTGTVGDNKNVFFFQNMLFLIVAEWFQAIFQMKIFLIIFLFILIYRKRLNSSS